MCGLKSRAKQYGVNFIHALQNLFLDFTRRNTHLLFFFCYLGGTAFWNSGTCQWLRHLRSKKVLCHIWR